MREGVEWAPRSGRDQARPASRHFLAEGALRSLSGIDFAQQTAPETPGRRVYRLIRLLGGGSLLLKGANGNFG